MYNCGQQGCKKAKKGARKLISRSGPPGRSHATSRSDDDDDGGGGGGGSGGLNSVTMSLFSSGSSSDSDSDSSAGAGAGGARRVAGAAARKGNDDDDDNDGDGAGNDANKQETAELPVEYRDRDVIIPYADRPDEEAADPATFEMLISHLPAPLDVAPEPFAEDQ